MDSTTYDAMSRHELVEMSLGHKMLGAAYEKALDAANRRVAAQRKEIERLTGAVIGLKDDVSRLEVSERFAQTREDVILAQAKEIERLNVKHDEAIEALVRAATGEYHAKRRNSVLIEDLLHTQDKYEELVDAAKALAGVYADLYDHHFEGRYTINDVVNKPNTPYYRVLRLTEEGKRDVRESDSTVEGASTQGGTTQRAA